MLAREPGRMLGWGRMWERRWEPPWVSWLEPGLKPRPWAVPWVPPWMLELGQSPVASDEHATAMRQANTSSPARPYFTPVPPLLRLLRWTPFA